MRDDFLVLWFFKLIFKGKVNLQQLKGMQSSKLGMKKGYYLPKKRMYHETSIKRIPD